MAGGMGGGRGRKYEELIDDLPPVRKPGYVSPREEAEKERKRFAEQLIEALKFADEASKQAKPRPQLAAAAHGKLQYDFPDVSVEELQALAEEVEELSASGGAAGRASSSAGASSSGGAGAAGGSTAGGAAASGAAATVGGACAGAKARQQRLLQLAPTTQLVASLAEASKGRTQSGTAAAGGGNATGRGPGGTDGGASGGCVGPHADAVAAARVPWQRAAAAYCVHLLAYLLALTPREAWALLTRFEPPPDPSAEPSAAEPPAPALGAVAAAAGLAPASQEGSGVGGAGTLEERYAAQQDGDDFVYEDFGGASAGPAGRAPARQAAGAAAPPARFSPAALQARLLALGGALDAECFNGDGAWRDTGLMTQLAACISVAAAHEYAAELEPLASGLAGIAAARMASSSPDLDSLPALWAALGGGDGGGGGGSGGGARASGGGGAGAGAPWGSHVLLGFTANLAGQCKAPALCAKLSRHVQASLLPQLTSALELAAAAPDKGRGDARVTAQLMAACQVLEFHALHGASKAALATKLTAGGGALRPLSTVLAARALEHDAEPLRRCALMCAAASPDVAAWLGQVPGLPALLGGQYFQTYEVLEAHGAGWALLLEGRLPGHAQGPGPRLQRLEGGCGMAAEEGDDIMRLSRASRILQMLADMKDAAGARRLLHPGLLQQLRGMAARLRAAQEASTPSPAAQQGAELPALASGGAMQPPAAPDAARSGTVAPGDAADEAGAAGSGALVGVADAAASPGHGAAGGGAGVSGQGGGHSGDVGVGGRDGGVGVGGGGDDGEGGWAAAREEKLRQLQALCLRLLKRLVVDARGKDD